MSRRRPASTAAFKPSPTSSRPAARRPMCRCCSPERCVSLNVETDPVSIQDAGIADLAAGFRVERRAIENHHAGLAGLQRIEPAAFRVVEAKYFTGLGNRLIAQKVDPGIGVNLLPEREIETRRGPSLVALPAHGPLESVHVGAQAPFAGDVLREIGREAVGIVELEDDIPRNHRAPQAADRLLEQFHAPAQRSRKALFFPCQSRLDLLLLLAEQRIGAAHLCNEIVHQQMKEGFTDIQLVAVPQRSPDDAAQHVIAVFVARQHAVGNEKGAGPQVIGDDPYGRILQHFPLTGQARQASGPAHEPPEQVDFEVAVHALQNRSHAFQPHARIDTGLRQRLERAVRRPVELGKHQVPELDVAVALFVRRTGRAAGNRRPAVVEQFRAGAAGTRIAHGPEVGLVVDDAVGRNTDLPGPQRPGLVIRRVHGYPEALSGQGKDLGHEFPGPGDGFFLEVVAEAEVAEHLEKGEVTGGITHVFQVVVLAARAYALLGGCRALVTGVLAAEQGILELVHARVGEQQGRVVVRHQRA